VIKNHDHIVRLTRSLRLELDGPPELVKRDVVGRGQDRRDCQDTRRRRHARWDEQGNPNDYHTKAYGALATSLGLCVDDLIIEPFGRGNGYGFTTLEEGTAEEYAEEIRRLSELLPFPAAIPGPDP
jgi:hypothetical protein